MVSAVGSCVGSSRYRDAAIKEVIALFNCISRLFWGGYKR
jgi:hypothetical protein